MSFNCSNCSQPISANFCSNCGQKKYKRIDRKYVLDEVQYSLIHTNKGFLYSVKNIAKSPGKTARDFIFGNRVNHYKPLLLTFMLTSISTFLAYKVLNMQTVMAAVFATQHMTTPFMTDLMSFLSSYNSFVYLALVPLFALSTKITFGNWGENYYEHIVMNAYSLSFYNMLCIVIVYPILYFFRDNPNTFISISSISTLAIPIIQVWFFKDFYREKSLKSVIVRAVASLGLMGIAYVVLIFITTMIIMVIMMVNGKDEALKYFMPQ